MNPHKQTIIVQSIYEVPMLNVPLLLSENKDILVWFGQVERHSTLSQAFSFQGIQIGINGSH